MTKILVFGDSIAWGAFDSEKGGWVEKLKSYFLSVRPEVRYNIYNLAISSNTTKLVLKFMKNDIERINTIGKDPYIFIFSIGSNDTICDINKENFWTDKEEFANNLNAIINIAKEYSDKIIFTGLFNMDESKTIPFQGGETGKECYFNDVLNEYNNIIQNVCIQNNLPFIPIKEDFYDGVHPNAKGHEKIFEKVKTELNKILK